MKILISFLLLNVCFTYKTPGSAMVTNLIQMNISVNGTPFEDPILIGLFGKDVPYTVENFYKLCVDDNLYSG